jgi:hypothetical protein
MTLASALEWVAYLILFGIAMLAYYTAQWPIATSVQHFALHDQSALAAEFDRRANVPVRGDSIAESEFCSHIGIGQRLEDFLGRRRNIDRVDEKGLTHHEPPVLS